ncbi:MAG: hypothetical protein E6686_08410 [Lachnospiraceae bacterium]|nr:hypothetical protein [Lachnospiraceae bacterium]
MKYKIILSAAVILAGLLLTSCTVKQEETKTQNLIIEEPSYSGTVTIFKENQKVFDCIGEIRVQNNGQDTNIIVEMEEEQ